jgi:hypothetical protein
MDRSLKSSPYHRRENPSHTELRRLALKEYTMTSKMGTYIRRRIKKR